ncbi:zinc finger BED domain-containing protein RICESLEEPER 1-like [Coffea arabica]|uniref:Zinc finger BED domain-containing protein RICESLEEPER 1-like n=1 Tax=Coffea arabica TaxID=13443 RepID=A0ABM4WMJ9_COFAR
MSIACDLDDDVDNCSHGSNMETYKRSHLVVWPHFHRLEPDEHGKQKAICKTCGKKYLADNVSGTSSLLRHLASHARNEEQPTGLATVDHEIYRDKGFDVYQSQQWASGNKSELELYLDERLVDRKQQPDLNVLTYWKESRIRYPELSLMARDILSILITTVASEHAFSHGGRILEKFRTSMLLDNMEALLCSRNWLYNSKESPDKYFEVEQEDDEQDLGIDISRFIAEQDASSNVDT